MELTASTAWTIPVRLDISRLLDETATVAENSRRWAGRRLTHPLRRFTQR